MTDLEQRLSDIARRIAASRVELDRLYEVRRGLIAEATAAGVAGTRIAALAGMKKQAVSQERHRQT